MSARRFRADVGSITTKVQQGELPGVTAVSRGDSHGEIVLTYQHVSLPRPVRIQVLAQDVSEYPDGNNFMLFTDSDDAPAELTKAMEHVQEYLVGITVTEMVMEVAKSVTSALTATTSHGNDSDEEMTDVDDAQYDDEENGISDDDDNDFIGDDDEYFGLGSSIHSDQQRQPSVRPDHRTSSLDEALRLRIRADLRITKQAGFRVGVLNGLGTSGSAGIVCVSIRARKLDLSEEALLAWDIPETDYVVLLIKYDTRYLTLDRIVELPAAYSGLQFRIGLCQSYKPGTSEAYDAFSKLEKTQEPARPTSTADSKQAFRPMFLSASLNQFMNESLVSLVKLRLSEGTTWDHANEILLQNSSMAFKSGGGAMLLDKDESEDSGQGSGTGEEHNHILESDHLLETREVRSFPLVAMQFAMRYMTRCTQYCLRCHRKVEEGFEALRPYVCSDPLCLFQYMAMGLGPNVEHEILTEPSVVDLLVSLCYASLQATHTYEMRFGIPTSTTPGSTYPIREFPVGLRLLVPNVFGNHKDRPSPINVQLDRRSTPALLFPTDDDAVIKRLHVNQWLVLRYRGPGETSGGKKPMPDMGAHSFGYNARITSILPDKGRVEIELMVGSNVLGGASSTFPVAEKTADVYFYDVDFDSLSDSEKALAMQFVLNTLPRIATIREYLLHHPNTTLRACEAVSPAAATLLVWIVSSNRSCIHEIGTFDTSSEIETTKAKGQTKENTPAYWTVKEKRKKEFISGVNGYIQFRFSQGSPDKELRFNKALQEMAQEKDLSQYPTLFAWHGSDVSNWHSILRTGLDFKEIKCGRAFGNGVYFSPHFSTSTSYAQSHHAARWPRSDLNVQSILSLNEIINAPEKFVSQTPHYVVQELDWHQCRYLFVSSSASMGSAGISTRVTTDEDQAAPILPQAPGKEITGPAGVPLSISVASMPTRTGSPAQGGLLVASKSTARAIDQESEDSADEDQDLLADHRPALTRSSSVETILAQNFPRTAPPTPVPEGSLTDFRPGTLDLSTLPRLTPPSWATPTASRAIGRELHKLQQLQTTTPLRELGWYINFEAVSNMFQWIVELHSFDPSTPLAKDMKSAGVTSIVMEFRFGKDWPMSPPFVRAVRPRFRLFAEGGGGHVTAGGAMCMELLTNSGWSPANSMESVILQVRMALCTEERGARLDLTPAGRRMQDYGVGEAVDAYMRAAMVHGWQVPADLRMTAYGGAPEGSTKEGAIGIP